MLDIIIVGAGGFAREVCGLLWHCFCKDQFRLKGFLSRNREELQGTHVDLPVLDDPECYQPTAADRFVLAIGNMKARRQTVEALLVKGGQFLTMIHPTALVADTARIGKGAVIYPYATLSNCAVLDDHVHLSIYASLGHDTRVGRYCLLSPYATLNGFAVIGDDVFMGTHSMIGPENRLGDNSKVCANTCVLHDVPADSFVYGVPGRHTRRLDAS